MLNKIKALFQSRRFYAAVGGVLQVVFQDVLGMTPEQSLVVAGLLATWIVGDSMKKTE